MVAPQGIRSSQSASHDIGARKSWRVESQIRLDGHAFHPVMPARPGVTDQRVAEGKTAPPACLVSSRSPSHSMQALPLPKPPLPARALSPPDTLPTTEHTSTSAEHSPPQPLPITGAHESRSLPRSPRPAAPPDDVQSTGAADGGGNGNGTSVQPPQPPPPPSRLRSHDSLTGAAVHPRSRATSVKPDPVPIENGSSNGAPAAPASNSAQGNGSNNNRPLNVTDALSYLDAVKVQFHDKPDVYNHFLDIMKDFKSQMYVFHHHFLTFPSLRFLLFGSRCVGSYASLIVRDADASFWSHLLHCLSCT
jgi:hypothetical protein